MRFGVEGCSLTSHPKRGEGVVVAEPSHFGALPVHAHALVTVEVERPEPEGGVEGV